MSLRVNYLRLRRNKSAIFRLIFAFVSIAAVFILLSRTIRSSDSDTSDEPIDSESDRFIHHSAHKLMHLSAKQKQIFNHLNPVVRGWGEKGDAVHLRDPKDKKQSQQLFKTGAFDVFISDRISPNRTLPDARPYECSKVSYNLKRLGTASVVIIYTNEIWSALIRTLWSVWNRTPDILLKDIILVDDNSDRDELRSPLDDYISYYFGDRIKVMRLPKREGLIRARLIGAKEAKGDVIVFLDSHCEVTIGWLEPLLQRITENPSAVVCPVIDVISDKTLEYFAGNPYYFQIGGFTWNGHFTWIDIPEDLTKRYPTKPVASPTMAGGLFAVNRKYFFDIGSYDDSMEIWGGENLEFSFRIWQCGGRLEISPCSHVGHIFRDYHPYSFGGKDTHGLNTLRTVLVWMDDYQKYFFMFRNDLRNANAGDLKPRFQLKKRLNCKSFKWYLDNVYGGKKFIFDVNAKAYGYVRNPISNLCLDNLNRDDDKLHNLGLYICSTDRPQDTWTNQVFTLTNTGELRREEACATGPFIGDNKVVTMEKCAEPDLAKKRRRRTANEEKKVQLWKHSKGGQIINIGTGLCLTTKKLANMGDVQTDKCNDDDPYQIWWFQTYTDISVS